MLCAGERTATMAASDASAKPEAMAPRLTPKIRAKRHVDARRSFTGCRSRTARGRNLAMDNIQRPFAVVTGASSGLGAQMAPRLAKAGYNLLLVARRADLLEQVARDARAEGADVRVMALDLSERASVSALVAAAKGAKVLVNAAGFAKMGPAFSFDREIYAKMLDLNVQAITALTYELASSMKASGGGVILNVASSLAFTPTPFAAVYAASKAYIVSFSEALHFELRGTGVSVLAFCPGPFASGFNAVAEVEAEVVARWKGVTIGIDQVADAAVSAIAKRRESALPGFLNALAVVLGKWLPRGAMRSAQAKIFAPSAKKG
jgi:uncharacterized protein